MRLRVLKERDQGSLMYRLMGDSELAYVIFGLRGLEAKIEFPSDWHEHRRGWVRIGLGFMKIACSFPWKWTVPDDYQCSGPTFGFCFFEDGLHIHWGKSHGTRNDPFKVIGMPWRWQHREHAILSEAEEHPYVYLMRDGTVQIRTATIQSETRRWTRWWLPHSRTSHYINIDFDKGIGENSDSWKGGCTGCSYEMRQGEKPVDALRRMELERKFT